MTKLDSSELWCNYPVDKPVTQTAFAAMVGITQPSVSGLLTRGVLRYGAPLGEWIISYTEHLRQVGEDRGETGELQLERARLLREQTDAIATANAARRAKYAPTVLMEAIVANIGAQIAAELDQVLPDVLRRFPQVNGAPAEFIRERLRIAREAAAGARFTPDELEADLGEDGGDL